MSLQQLQALRRTWVEANRNNDFEDGIYRFLTELYPDNAHFIYELLQNAEDAGASEVLFRLGHDALEFEHDGSRLFTLEDVRSITSIGTSTKLNDETTIGKFGVGFKAVFSYTSKPEIHSGGFHFHIVDLVVPELIPSDNKAAASFQTRFRFRFDHATKRPDSAVQEITDGLVELSPNSLLFLTNIRTLRFVLPDGTRRQITRVDEGNERIRIEQHDGTRVETTHWLRLGGEVEVSDGDISLRKHWVAAAFQLAQVEPDPASKAKRVSGSRVKRAESGWRVRALSEGQGQVSIFFPAVKEVSHLRFHIHAPFASTVARDSVSNTEGNRELLEGLATVVANGLAKIRDLGLLDEHFLEALPNAGDQVADIYRPFIDVLVERFNHESVTPMRGGGHAPATELVVSPLQFYVPLDIGDVRFLMDRCETASDKSAEREFPQWLLSRQDLPARAKQFLEQVSAREFGWKQLRSTIDGLNDNWWERNSDVVATRRANFEEWLAGKNNSRIRNLYRLFALLPEYGQHVTWPALRIVRVQGGGAPEMYLPAEAYFAPPGQKIDRFDFVLPSILTTTERQNSNEDSKIRGFLSKLGTREWDETARIKLVLDKYRDRDGESLSLDEIPDQYFTDLHQILDFHRSDPDKEQLLVTVPFLIGTDTTGDPVWCRANDLVLDAPYSDTGLATIASEIGKKKTLWGGYASRPESSALQVLADKLGTLTRLKVYGIECNESNAEFDARWIQGGRSSEYKLSQDWWIAWLAPFLRSKSIPLMRQVWLALISGEEKHRSAKFRLNKTAVTHTMSSRLVQTLGRNAWIPDRNGEYRLPSDIGGDDLRDDFPLPESRELLDAIGFGQKEQQSTQAARTELMLAQALGFDTAARAKKFATLSALLTDEQLDDLARNLSDSNADPDLPGSLVRNPERRSTNVIEGEAEGPRKESVLRVRAVRVDTEERERSRTYLRAEYADDDRVICQACHSPMPFKVRGADYFESVECVKDRDRVSHQNRLALCPLCAAKYKHARATTDDELREIFASLTIDAITDHVSVPVLLAGDSVTLHFGSKHAFDLQTVLGTDSSS
jgi:hypothetical protein